MSTALLGKPTGTLLSIGKCPGLSTYSPTYRKYIELPGYSTDINKSALEQPGMFVYCLQIGCK